MADLTPNNREEHWLQGMVDGSTTLTPNKRREYWYKEIIDAQSGGGGGGGALIVMIAGGENLTMDKTFGEIKSALLTTAVIFQRVYEVEGAYGIFGFEFIDLQDITEGGKVIHLTSNGDWYDFVATTDNDYPSRTEIH